MVGRECAHNTTVTEPVLLCFSTWPTSVHIRPLIDPWRQLMSFPGAEQWRRRRTGSASRPRKVFLSTKMCDIRSARSASGRSASGIASRTEVSSDGAAGRLGLLPPLRPRAPRLLVGCCPSATPAGGVASSPAHLLPATKCNLRRCDASCANMHSSSRHDSRPGHIFVRERSGAARSSRRPWANEHRSPFVQSPAP